MQALVSVHLSPTIDLSADERRRAEERLLALAFIEAHGLLQSRSLPSDAQTSRRDLLQSIMDLLPVDAKSTKTWHLIQAIASGNTTLPGKVSDPANATQRTAADQTIEALAMLLKSEPRKSLEILETTEPPESLRLIHWMTRGCALMEIGEPRRAISAFTMALRDSNVSDVVLNRGLAYLKMAKWSDAEADFTTCIQQSPDDVSGYLNRYAVRAAMGRTEDAMRDLNRAVELQPDSARLRLIRSRELRNAGQLKASREDFDLAMKSSPRTVEDWLSVALAKLQIDPEQALKDLESAETLHGPDESILQTMAHVLSEHLNRPEDAIRALDRVLQTEPTFQKALGGRSVLHARLGNSELALNDVRQLESLEADLTGEALYQMACSVACARELNQTFNREPSDCSRVRSIKTTAVSIWRQMWISMPSAVCPNLTVS